MHPRRGVTSSVPQASQDFAQAESVASYPAFMTHQLTNAEHQGVSSFDCSSVSSAVLLRYSTTRGLSAVPAYSLTPSSCNATGIQENSSSTMSPSYVTRNL